MIISVHFELLIYIILDLDLIAKAKKETTKFLSYLLNSYLLCSM